MLPFDDGSGTSLYVGGSFLVSPGGDSYLARFRDCPPPPVSVDADLNCDFVVNGVDLGMLLAFWGPVGTTFPQADINNDGQVNGIDLGILLSQWFTPGGGSADLNNDSVVDGVDLGILLNNWTF